LLQPRLALFLSQHLRSLVNSDDLNRLRLPAPILQKRDDNEHVDETLVWVTAEQYTRLRVQRVCASYENAYKLRRSPWQNVIQELKPLVLHALRELETDVRAAPLQSDIDLKNQGSPALDFNPVAPEQHRLVPGLWLCRFCSWINQSTNSSSSTSSSSLVSSLCVLCESDQSKATNLWACGLCTCPNVLSSTHCIACATLQIPQPSITEEEVLGLNSGEVSVKEEELDNKEIGEQEVQPIKEKPQEEMRLHRYAYTTLVTPEDLFHGIQMSLLLDLLFSFL